MSLFGYIMATLFVLIWVVLGYKLYRVISSSGKETEDDHRE